MGGIFFFFFFFAPQTLAATGWVTDHNNCDTSYLSIDCPAGERICAYDGTLTCGAPTTINALLPGINGEADNKNYQGTGGYLLNCTQSASDCTDPWECKAAQTCADKNLKTTCTGGSNSASCGTCLTGYLDCNGNGTGSDVDGCEIQIGSACTDGGLTGTYENTCQGGGDPPVCNTENVSFRTAEQASASSSNPLLWGAQYGTGDLLNLSKDGGNSVVIDNDGNMGIGTTSPTEKLEVNGGTTKFTRETAASTVPTIVRFHTNGGSEFLGQIHGKQFNGANTLGISAASGNNLALSTNNNWATPQLFIETDGNVGIGTTGPGAKLDIRGTNSDTGLILSGIDTNFPSYFEFKYPNASGDLLNLARLKPIKESGGGGSLAFETSADGSAAYDTKLVIKRDGNVGIGTTSPGEKLEVAGNINLGTTTTNFPDNWLDSDANSKFISLKTGSTSGTTGIFFRRSDSDSVTGGDFWYHAPQGDIYLDNRHGTGDIYFRTATSGTPKNIMALSNSGNVGIGITSPTEALDVAGNIASTGTICDGAGNCLDTLQDTEQWTASGDDISYSTGNVGVGIASPTAQLHTKGNLSTALTGTVSVTAAATAVTGTGTAFTTELAVGDAIKIGSEVFTVSAIGSDTALTLDSAHTAGASGATAYTDTTLLAVETGDAGAGLTVDKTGNVGIGTTSPSTTLDIAGGVKVGTQSTFGVGTTQSCTTSLKGTVQYNPDQNAMNYCNGSAWVQFGVSGCPTAVRDNDGNWYDTVQIGDQCWTAENINVGTKIDDPGSSAIAAACSGNSGTVQTIGGIECYCISETYASCHRSGSGGTTQKYCYSNTESNCTSDGALYEWQEAMDLPANCAYTDCSGSINTPHQGICPDGWHIPTDDEWKTLEGQLGMSTADQDLTGWRGTDEGDKLKTIDKCLGGVDCASSLFSAPLAGYRYVSGGFNNSGSSASVWSSSQYSSTDAWRRYLYSGYSTVNRLTGSKGNGFSRRCLKD